VPNFKNAFREFLNTVKDDIVAYLTYEDLRATGNAIDTLRVITNKEQQAELRGVRYIQNLVRGVGSQPRGIGREFLENLKRWAFFRGIEARAVYPIAKTIVEKGTSIKQRERGIPPLERIVNENKPQLLKDVSNELILGYLKRRNGS
jgi:hypothetical protein